MKRQLRLGALLAAALAVALVLWIVLDGRDEPARTGNAAQSAAGSRLDERGLVERARTLAGRTYWVGPRNGSAYELTTTPAGRAFVRYLPKGVEAGDPRPDFLTVATYPLGASAVAALKRAGRESGMQTIELPGGALLVTNPATPTSAFYARPGWDFQIEVYDPSPGEAVRLVLAGALRAVA